MRATDLSALDRIVSLVLDPSYYSVINHYLLDYIVFHQRNNICCKLADFDLR